MKRGSLRHRDVGFLRPRSLIDATGQESTVNVEGGACDESGRVGGQVHGSTRQFLDFSKTLHRCSHNKLLPANRSEQ